MPRIINATAIALIPKKVCPPSMKNFRPISCCNVIYKCTAKLVANKMKLVFPNIFHLVKLLLFLSVSLAIM